MKYKTLSGVAGNVDDEVNALAEKGWVVHSFITVGMVTVETEEGPEDLPVLTYLMVMDDTPEPVTRSERRVLGRST